MADSDVQEFLNKLNGDDPPPPTEEVETVEGIKVTDNGHSIETESLEVSGIIIDSEGNQWVVPDGNVEDWKDLDTKSGLTQIKKDPRFHYQTININDVDEYLTNGWVLVTRKEAGLPELQIQKEGYGLPLGNYVRYMDTVYVKKPTALVKRDRMILDEPAKAAMADLDPSEEMREKMREADIPMKHKHIRTQEEISQQTLDDLVMKENR